MGKSDLVCPTCQVRGVAKQRLKARFCKAYGQKEEHIGYWRLLVRVCKWCNVPYAFKHFSTLEDGSPWQPESARYTTLFEYEHAAHKHPLSSNGPILTTGTTEKFVLSSEYSRRAAGKKITRYG